MKIVINIIGVLVVLTAYTQVPAPAPSQEEPVAIMNGIAHLGNGEVIENSVITFEGGKIKLVADARLVRVDLRDYRKVDAAGKHVYPGLILPVTRLGLVDINAVRATRDYAEVGLMKPHVRSAIAYNTDSELIPTMRFNGIQIVQTTPVGGRISGTSSIMQLDAWNWEDALYKEDDAVHLHWPVLMNGPKWWLGETRRSENEEYANQVNEILQFLEDARSYARQGEDARKRNLKLEAMVPVFDGEKQLFIYANRAKEIIEALQTLKKCEIPKMVLVGGEDALYAKDLLKELEVPVLLQNVHRMPNRNHEDVDLPYRLPGLLHNEGILVGLTYQSGMIASSRNLPFFAGTVAAYGLDKEAALKMVTSNTAKILGIDNLTGTLESGKDANVVISEGDLLDMRTNNILYSFIQGRQISMEALQQRLFDKYRAKYEEQE